MKILSLLSLSFVALQGATVGVAPWQGTTYSAIVGTSTAKYLLPSSNANFGPTSSFAQTFNGTQTGQSDIFSINGTADAQFGSLKAYLQATVTNGLAQTYVSAAYAGTFERFTIDAPGLTGQAGTATFRLNLNGVTSFTRSSNTITGPSGGAYVCANISAVQVYLDLAPCDSGTRNTNGSYTASIPFTFGTSFTVFMDIFASVWFGTNISGWNATFTSDYSHTAILDQIAVYSGSTVSSANQVNGFSIAGASNAAYSANGVVPEPSTYMLVGAGLVSLALVRGRKRQ